MHGRLEFCFNEKGTDLHWPRSMPVLLGANIHVSEVLAYE